MSLSVEKIGVQVLKVSVDRRESPRARGFEE